MDGIILIHPSGNMKNPLRIPSVALTLEKEYENIETLKLNLSSAIDNAVCYLKELGHKQIGFAGETLTEWKILQFRNAMRKAGFPVQKE